MMGWAGLCRDGSNRCSVAFAPFTHTIHTDHTTHSFFLSNAGQLLLLPFFRADLAGWQGKTTREEKWREADSRKLLVYSHSLL